MRSCPFRLNLRAGALAVQNPSAGFPREETSDRRPRSGWMMTASTASPFLLGAEPSGVTSTACTILPEGGGVPMCSSTAGVGGSAPKSSGRRRSALKLAPGIHELRMVRELCDREPLHPVHLPGLVKLRFGGIPLTLHFLLGFADLSRNGVPGFVFLTLLFFLFAGRHELQNSAGS